ncbi:hypothetical protein B0H14DRAFT_3134333 [Mycena olivaceomarginata]|nr:hypothetical protein B0H14DRAFT_3134333 [Mycena olivaceomarginata]
MQAALDTFHAHKQVFVDLKIWKHFNIPKIHSLQHYVDEIRRLGSADGYNTESPERLHIDFAKKAYRASNRRDYTEQMALWLQRQEAIALRSAYIQWYHNKQNSASDESDTDSSDSEDDTGPPPGIPQVIVHLPPTQLPTTAYKIAKSPAIENRQKHYPRSRQLPQLHFKSSPVPGIYDHFDIFTQISLSLPRNRYLSDQPRSSRIRAIPPAPAKGRSAAKPAVFDTVLVIEDPSQYDPSSGMTGLRPVQIRAIFKLPPPFGTYSHPLAYIEWFTPLNKPDPVSGMFTTHRSTRNHIRNSAVISVEHICGSTIDRKWTSSNVLEEAKMFYVNPYDDIWLHLFAKGFEDDGESVEMTGLDLAENAAVEGVEHRDEGVSWRAGDDELGGDGLELLMKDGECGEEVVVDGVGRREGDKTRPSVEC